MGPDEMRFVRVWSGKWHILAKVEGTHEAEPVGPFNRVAKPERTEVLTTCGEQAYAREIADTMQVYGRWSRPRVGRWCDKCWPVWKALTE